MNQLLDIVKARCAWYAKSVWLEFLCQSTEESPRSTKSSTQWRTLPARMVALFGRATSTHISGMVVSSILYISLNLGSKGHIETKGSCKPLRANTCLSRSDTRPRNLAVNNFSLSHESQLKQQRWRTLGQWKVKISLAICRQSIL